MTIVNMKNHNNKKQLEPIEEEKPFSATLTAMKISDSGFFKNSRVLKFDDAKLSYFSQSKDSTPKRSFPYASLQRVEVQEDI